MERILENIKTEYDKLSDEVKQPLNTWINSLKQSDEYNYNHTSIGLSQQFEIISMSLFGKPFCVSNDQFKYAMYINGFEPDAYEDYSWCFKIDEKQDFNWSE